MPSKRNQANNAFYWFMQDILPDLKREGRLFPNGLQDVVPIAHPRWKQLSDKERDRYVQKANQEKQRANHRKGRLDTLGNVIADRKDPEKELERRNINEARLARKEWPADKDVKDTKFYFISFEYLCKTEEGDYLPCEMAMIEWSMTSGISKMLQKFIEPEQIPLGYRYMCESHSQETHHIPVKGFDLADGDYTGIWIQMENFINPNGEKEEYPPVYCLDADRAMVLSCLDVLFIGSQLCDQASRRNRLVKLYAIEVMVTDLYAHVGSGLSSSAAINMLATSAFDYEPNTVCKWHEEEEVKYCALGTIKKYAYALADALSNIYDFELTSSHLPTRSAQQFYAPVPSHAFSNEQRSWTRGTSAPVRQPDRQTPPDRLGERRQEVDSGSGGGGGGGGGAQGTFGATDIRLRTQRQPRDDDTSPMRQPTGDSVASRLAAASSYTAPVAPWSKAVVPQAVANNESEFPSLRADCRDKFASRSAAPPSDVLPKPAFNQNKQFDDGDSAAQSAEVRPPLSTMNQAGPSSSAPPNAWTRGGGARGGGGTRGGRGSCWTPGGVHQPSQPPATQLAGVGRGLWMPNSGGRSSGPAQPPTVRNPPPGFGRGLAAQLAGLSVDHKPGAP